MKILALVLSLALLAAASPSALERPGDFPIPSPGGGRVLTVEWSGSSGHITLGYPAQRHREILDYYDEYTEGAGWRRGEMGRGEPPTTNYLNLERGRNISVDPPGGGRVIVTLTVS